MDRRSVWRVFKRAIWYGGIDIFGGSYDDNSVIRVQNEELANELVGAIEE